MRLVDQAEQGEARSQGEEHASEVLHRIGIIALCEGAAVVMYPVGVFEFSAFDDSAHFIDDFEGDLGVGFEFDGCDGQLRCFGYWFRLLRK